LNSTTVLSQSSTLNHFYLSRYTTLSNTGSSSTLLHFDKYRTTLSNMQRDPYSIDSLRFLRIQHQSTTMRCRSHKLPIVRIFLKAADQAKNTTLERTLLCQIHQGKGLLLWGMRNLYNDPISNNPLLEGPNKTCLHHPVLSD
jgi:hypothetical protein